MCYCNDASATANDACFWVDTFDVRGPHHLRPVEGDNPPYYGPDANYGEGFYDSEGNFYDSDGHLQDDGQEIQPSMTGDGTPTLINGDIDDSRGIAHRPVEITVFAYDTHQENNLGGNSPAQEAFLSFRYSDGCYDTLG